MSENITSTSFLDNYPDFMTAKEVAEILRIGVGTVYALKGLRRIRVGNGRGHVRISKRDLVSYINDSYEDQEDIGDVCQQEERHRKMGVPNLLPWKELQALHVEHSGRSTRSRKRAVG